MIGRWLAASLSGSFTLLAMAVGVAVSYYLSRDREARRNEYYYRGYSGAIQFYFGPDQPESPVTDEVRDRAYAAYAKITGEAAAAVEAAEAAADQPQEPSQGPEPA